MMQIALINGERVKPTPYAKGAICPLCKTEVIAKCGEQKIHHWAHKNKIQCDLWCETPTLRHQSWKECFPEDWWEHIVDRNGEHHIADIETENGTIVLLSQKSFKEKLMTERENFFQTPVWVIHASRYERSVKKFSNALKVGLFLKPHSNVSKNAFDYWLLSKFHEDEVFKPEWLKSQFPVFLDFTFDEKSESEVTKSEHNFVWCLMPFCVRNYRVLYRYDKGTVVKMLKLRPRMSARDVELKKQIVEEDIKKYLENRFWNKSSRASGYR